MIKNIKCPIVFQLPNILDKNLFDDRLKLPGQNNTNLYDPLNLLPRFALENQ